MPSGVYPRTKNQLIAAKTNLSKGRSPEARKKAAKTLKEIAQNPEWRKKVSEATKEAMNTPKIRTKHLAGLKKAREKHGVNFRGGNGQELTEIVKLADSLFSQCGYIREYPIRTKPVRMFSKMPQLPTKPTSQTQNKR